METFLISLIVIFSVAGYCKLSARRKERSEVARTCLDHYVFLHMCIERVKAVDDTNRKDIRSLKRLANRCVHFLDRAAADLVQNQPEQAGLHINLVSITMAWVDFALRFPHLDATRCYEDTTSTSRLEMGFQLLQERNHSDAEFEFAEEWLDEDSHVLARQVAVSAHLYIAQLLRRRKDIAEFERMLTKLSRLRK